MISCLRPGCDAGVERVERYHVSVVWEPTADGRWDFGAYDTGTHFHVFCADGHEVKCWGRHLPREIQDIVFPGS